MGKGVWMRMLCEKVEWGGERSTLLSRGWGSVGKLLGLDDKRDEVDVPCAYWHPV